MLLLIYILLLRVLGHILETAKYGSRHHVRLSELMIRQLARGIASPLTSCRRSPPESAWIPPQTVLCSQLDYTANILFSHPRPFTRSPGKYRVMATPPLFLPEPVIQHLTEGIYKLLVFLPGNVFHHQPHLTLRLSILRCKASKAQTRTFTVPTASRLNFSGNVGGGG